MPSTKISAQQPQTQATTSSTNAQWANGVAPGYWPTSGSGLTLDISGGTAICQGTIETFSSGTLSMMASATNYVYLNSSASCAPAVKTTAFTAGDLPIAVVVTSGSTITTVTDVRTWFSNSIASLANTTLCNSGTAPSGTPGVAEPIDGISTTGQGNCIVQIVAPDGAGFFFNYRDGNYDQFLYNPYSYNGNNVTGTDIQYGIGLYNTLGDCTSNNQIQYPGLSGSNSIFFKPCWITIPSNYQFFLDGGYAPNDASPGSGGSYFGGLNPSIVPPSVYDPQISTFARYFHNTVALQSSDTSNITYNNPGICPFPFYATTYSGTSITPYANCNAVITPPSQETFNFTSPPYAGGGDPPTFAGHELSLYIYEGGHNENSAVGGRSITNVAPETVNVTRRTNAQVSQIWSTLGNLAGGGDVFVNNLHVSTGGFSSGADQGVGLYWGYVGTENYPATISVGTNTPAQFGFVVPTSAVAAHPAVQRFGNGSSGSLVSGVNNFVIDMGPAASWAQSHSYAAGTVITDRSGNVETVATAGTSGPTVPTWAASGNTVDGSVVWVQSVGPQGGYTKGNVINIGLNSSIGEYPLTGDSAANWQTLFGSSGNTTWYISEPLPTSAQSQFASGATPYTGSSATAAYWGCQSGTPNYNSAPVVGSASVQPYPLAAFCYQISGGTPPAVGSYVQITSLICSETAQVLYSDSTHMVATATCDHDYGPTKSVIYQGPGVGLGFGFKADTTPSNVTGGSTIQQIRPISQVDNSGHVYIWTTPNGVTSLGTGGSNNNYQGNAYHCTLTESFTGTNGSAGSSCSVNSQPNDVQPVVAAIGSGNYSGTSLTSLTLSNGGAYQPGHQLGSIPVTFTGGSCTTYPTAHFVSAYNAIGNYFYTSSITVDTTGSCSSFTGMTASGPTSTPNAYYIAPITQVTDVLSQFAVKASGVGYYSPSGNTNGYGNTFGGTEAQPNPYACPATVPASGMSCTASVYSAALFTGNSQAFSAGDYIDQPPPYFQAVTDNSQFGFQQWGISPGNRSVWEENINGTPPFNAAQVNVNYPWYDQSILSASNAPSGTYTTEFCALPWKPGTAYGLGSTSITSATSWVYGVSSGSTYIYEVTGAGTTGTAPPSWPASGSVTNGSVTFTWVGNPAQGNSNAPPGGTFGTNPRVCSPGVSTSGLLSNTAQGGTVTISPTLTTPAYEGIGYLGEANYDHYSLYPPATPGGYNASSPSIEGGLLMGICANSSLSGGDAHPCRNGVYDNFFIAGFDTGDLSYAPAKYGLEAQPMSGAMSLVTNNFRNITMYGGATSTFGTPAYMDTTVINGSLVASTLDVTGGATLAGGITSYKGYATAGSGQPVIYSSTSGSLSAGGSTMLCTGSSCPQGLYRYSGYAVTSTALGGAPTITFSMVFNDGTKSQTVSLGTLALTTSGNYVSFPAFTFLFAGGINTISISVSPTSFAGAAYTYGGTLERLQ